MGKDKNKRNPSISPTIIIGISFFLFITNFSSTCGYPTESAVEKSTWDDDTSTESLELDDAFEDDEVDHYREEALENLQKIFGIRGQNSNKSRERTPPQFMTELYNTIADTNGVTRGKNPYNAKIVRSFIESDSTSLQQRRMRHKDVYIFDISGLEVNESIIEAELHIFRKRKALKFVNPTILKSPYYLIRVYQILEGENMNEPDAHRLLNVHYVGAHATGWQVFNVKQAVLAWMAGVPNLGLMVTASTLFGDEVSIDFCRRNEYPGSREPILVLFDDDGKVEEKSPIDKINGVPHYYSYNDNGQEELVEKDAIVGIEGSAFGEEGEGSADFGYLDDFRNASPIGTRKKRNENEEHATEEANPRATDDNENKGLHKELDYGTQLGNNLETGEMEVFRRYKRIDRRRSFEKDLSRGRFYSSQEENDYPVNHAHEVEESDPNTQEPESFHRYTRSVDPKEGFVNQKNTKIEQVLSSMDIYERSIFRQQLKKNKFVKNGKTKEKQKAKQTSDYRKKQLRKRYPREIREDDIPKYNFESSENSDTTGCTKRDLFVDFQDLGLSDSIIAPRGYSAFHCSGRCDGNHLSSKQQSTNHAIIQEIVHKLSLGEDVQMPCCVPTKLLSISVLFFDDNGNTVLKVYENMVADRCGCR